MDDAPSVGCRGTSTTGTTLTVTRQSDSGKADFFASDTGVDSRWVRLQDLVLKHTKFIYGVSPPT